MNYYKTLKISPIEDYFQHKSNRPDLPCTVLVLVTCTKYSGLIVGKEEISLRLTIRFLLSFFISEHEAEIDDSTTQLNCMRLMVLLIAVSARTGHALPSSAKSRAIVSCNHLRHLHIRYNHDMASSSLKSADEASPSSRTAADDDLTLEEYILRLSEVRGHYRTTGTLKSRTGMYEHVGYEMFGVKFKSMLLGY